MQSVDGRLDVLALASGIITRYVSPPSSAQDTFHRGTNSNLAVIIADKGRVSRGKLSLGRIDTRNWNNSRSQQKTTDYFAEPIRNKGARGPGY